MKKLRLFNRIILIICILCVILILTTCTESEPVNESLKDTTNITESPVIEEKPSETENPVETEEPTEIIIEPIAVDNKCLKVVTGSPQWEGVNLSVKDLDLKTGNTYKFTFKIYTPDIPVGVILQTNTWTWIASAEASAIAGDKWTTLTGTYTHVNDVNTFSIVKRGDNGNYDSEIAMFYIDDFEVVDETDSDTVVYCEDFEGSAHKFKIGGKSVISVIDETLISKNELEIEIIREHALNVMSLKEIYKDYFLIGNVVNPSDLSSKDYDILKHHYNILTFENSMKPDAMWGNGGSYDVPAKLPSFEVDEYIGTIKNDKILLHGHALVWHKQSPNWLNLSAGDREDNTAVYKPYAEANYNLNNFITIVAGHYYENPDGLKIQSWDVLNEAVRLNDTVAINESNWGYHTMGHIWPATWNSPWYMAYGTDTPAGVNQWDYVYDAFYYARHADPDTILYYNDYGMEEPNQVSIVVNMVNAVNARYALEHPEANGRLLIEGIGMQEHDNIGTNLKDVENAIKAYITTGCKISITELDVGVPGYKSGEKLSPGDELKQGIYFAKLFNILKKYCEHIERVTFWGLNDVNWRPDELCQIFNPDNTTKLAYYAVTDPDKFLEQYDK
jgi:GH35 family endo-1,4-beta-xylanase